MVATPNHVPGQNLDPILQRLAALERKVDAIANKTLYSASIGAGGLTVGQGGSITMDGGNFSLADPAGDDLVSNDTVAGWGLNQPNITTPFYQLNLDAALQTSNRDNTLYLKYFGAHVINHPKVNFGVELVLSSSTGTGSWAMEWWAAPPLTVGSGTRMGSGGPVTFGQLFQGSYAWPSNMFGQLVFVGFEVALSSTATAGDWAGVSPYYFYGHGG